MNSFNISGNLSSSQVGGESRKEVKHE